MNWFGDLNPILQALIATTFTWGITLLGALMVCFFKEVNKKALNTILGFSAGVMIAASFWSLLLPSIELSEELGYIAWGLPALGFILGGLFVLLSDKFLDKTLSDKNSIKKDSLKRSILLVSAITLHNIPEGMSIGVAFGGISSGVSGMTLIGAIMLAVGIGIQNFPEGAAVSLPLRKEGFSRKKSFFIGQASALVEPISAVIGVILVLAVRSILPILLSFASGAMITVASRELLPESISENKNLSTLGLISGFVLMMVLDVALG
ncbi:MAG: ZIP family metal transporter [Bacilli bacterium]|nr:ZIP family metal transporter [Bacilli bacterium]